MKIKEGEKYWVLKAIFFAGQFCDLDFYCCECNVNINPKTIVFNEAIIDRRYVIYNLLLSKTTISNKKFGELFHKVHDKHTYIIGRNEKECMQAFAESGFFKESLEVKNLLLEKMQEEVKEQTFGILNLLKMRTKWQVAKSHSKT